MSFLVPTRQLQSTTTDRYNSLQKQNGYAMSLLSQQHHH
jgi:hypothetical protein